MSVIGEAALSAFFQVLFQKLASSELPNFAIEGSVREEILGWKKKLQTLRLVLDDAEHKQFQDKLIQNELVKEWLGELKHLAYDVEDILDEFATQCLRRKLTGNQATSPSKITTFTPWNVKFNFDVMSKIKEITARFERILKEMKELNLSENVRRTSSKVWQRPLSSCVQDEPTVYGRDGDKEKMREFLFTYKTGDAKIGVIPIVGMGGLGKTTLAKLVYNDDSIPRDHFQVKAWVCVSDVFDIMRVTKGILESITSQCSDLTELSAVQLQLNRQLAGKKFLLVLDDVWNDNYDNWHSLRSPLMDGAPGSKIIVTTRCADVAKMMGTIDYYDLKKISDDNCWLLFKKHAFENRSIAEHSELEKFGREIVLKRCGGLPLAARSLGGLLRSKERPNEWEEVLNNKLWSVFDGCNNILSILALSYYYLPSHLKRCFAYCAILPKSYEFTQEDILLLWMAEGLIPQANDKREMEDLGGDYFRELLSRSIFQTSGTHQSRFVMHNLLNDLAQKVAEDACLRLDDEVNVGGDSKRERVRHSSYIRGYFDDTEKLAPFRNMKSLRTFLPLSHESSYTSDLASCVPFELLKNLKFLRVLSFRHYNIKELPESIVDLKHLRYFDLSYTKIELLPESTTSLFNLQTLILRECRELRKLPSRMDNLINLRHLDMTEVNLIEGMPLEIKELRSLRTLYGIVISKGFFTLSNLMSLKSLRGELSISNLNIVVDASDAVKAKLKDKEGIRVLQLRWNTNAEVEDGGVHCDVLHGLQPHKNIEKLVVDSYGGTRFPSWIGNPTFNNIVQVRLEDCKKCTSLPQFGMLPNLKELFIVGMCSLQRVNQEFYGNNCSNPFPCLEVLCFEKMDNWEEWNDFEFEFRVLRKLFIKNCGMLSGKLPIHLPSLEKLIISDCNNLVASLPRLPVLSVLAIRTCREVDLRGKVDFNSLTTCILVDVSRITNLAKEGFVQRLKKFKKLTVSMSDSKTGQGISNLECMFKKCPELVPMVIDEDEELLQMELAESNLESLTLEGCDLLVKLPTWIQKLVFLEELTIKEWQSLVTLPEGDLPSELKVLRIMYCESLAELTVYNSHCLQELKIYNCGILISLGRRQLPPTLKKLSISWCKKLKSLLHKEDEGETSSSFSSTNLEDLKIENCENLASISSGSELPATLKRLVIESCSSLTSVLPRGILPYRLQTLHIEDCEKVESIAERFDYNTSLETVFISNCSSLKSLPDDIHNLASLESLFIWNCPKLGSFPKNDLPDSLLHLSINNCPLLKRRQEGKGQDRPILDGPRLPTFRKLKYIERLVKI